MLDISGSAHLFGGEDGMLSDMRARLMRAGLTVQIGLADTRGAAWGLAHHGEGVAPPGDILPALQNLPFAALRMDEKTSTALIRLGLRKIGELAAVPRAPLTRRFGPDVLTRLDQALGQQPEEIMPLADPPHYGVRMTLPALRQIESTGNGRAGTYDHSAPGGSGLSRSRIASGTPYARSPSHPAAVRAGVSRGGCGLWH